MNPLCKHASQMDLTCRICAEEGLASERAAREAAKRMVAELEAQYQCVSCSKLEPENDALRTSVAVLTERAERSEAQLARDSTDMDRRRADFDKKLCGLQHSNEHRALVIGALTKERDALRAEVSALKGDLRKEVCVSNKLGDEVDLSTKEGADLIAENMSLRAELERKDAALRDARILIEAELDRGYVLTHEPRAGEAWRARWNALLGRVEAALAPASEQRSEAAPKGLFMKYIISKSDGSPVDPKADYFVLRLDTDSRARHAARTYARDVASENPELAKDLEARCDKHAFVERGWDATPGAPPSPGTSPATQAEEPDRASNTDWSDAPHDGVCIGRPSETRPWCNHPAHWKRVDRLLPRAVGAASYIASIDSDSWKVAQYIDALLRAQRDEAHREGWNAAIRAGAKSAREYRRIDNTLLSSAAEFIAERIEKLARPAPSGGEK